MLGRISNSFKKDAYPLPRVDDILETLSGSQLCSTLDLANGYWQVEGQGENSFCDIRRFV